MCWGLLSFGFRKEVRDSLNFFRAQAFLCNVYFLYTPKHLVVIQLRIFLSWRFIAAFLSSSLVTIRKRFCCTWYSCQPKRFSFERLACIQFGWKTWVFVPWHASCSDYNSPQAIECCFLSCIDAVFLFCDVVHGAVPCHLFQLVGHHKLWCDHMSDRQADISRMPRDLLMVDFVNMPSIQPIYRHSIHIGSAFL